MDGASASVRANSWGNIVESKVLNDVHDVEQEVRERKERCRGEMQPAAVCSHKYETWVTWLYEDASHLSTHTLLVIPSHHHLFRISV